LRYLTVDTDTFKDISNDIHIMNELIYLQITGNVHVDQLPHCTKHKIAIISRQDTIVDFNDSAIDRLYKLQHLSIQHIHVINLNKGYIAPDIISQHK
jgi:hypothetical protein